IIFPFNLMRTWHIRLAIFWVATSFLAAGIFLAPMIAGREPKHQAWLAYGLLGALALVVFGSMAGEYIGIHGGLKNWWMWLGHQGWRRDRHDAPRLFFGQSGDARTPVAHPTDSRGR